MPRNLFSDVTLVGPGMSRMARTLLGSVTIPSAVSKWPMNGTSDRRSLSGVQPKSGPLDFATKNSFPLFFVCEKGLVHMYQNHFIYFPILHFCFATSQKPILPATRFPAVIERLKFMGFERRATAN